MNIINLYIIVSLFIVSLRYTHNRVNFIILTLLLLAVGNEVVTTILIENGVSHQLNTTLYLLLHNILWFYLQYIIIQHKKVVKAVVMCFISFGFLNFIFFEGQEEFNFHTFIFGAFLYISVFIYESFYQLKKENLSFFLSNKYLLLSAPILFFFGLSFVFGFRSKELAETFVFGKIRLYDFIIYFVNIIYYTLINIYIYREKRVKHAG